MHRIDHRSEAGLIVAKEARFLVIIAIYDAQQVPLVHLAAKKVRLVAESVVPFDSTALLKFASLWVSHRQVLLEGE